MSIRIQLLLVGLVILGYLGGRWWWLERKAKQHHRGQGDDAQGTSTLTSERIEPTMPEAQGVSEEAPLPVVAVDRRAVLHPQIDCIAMLDMDAPCSGDLALGLLPSTRRIGSKTWIVEGFNLATGAWEPVLSGQMYRYFQAGIQLVNRNGALNDVEFSEFVAKASSVADGLGASTEFPEMLAEVTRAEQLSQFTRAHDILLTLSVNAKRAAWSFAYVQQNARAAGFVAGAIPGRWVLGDAHHDMMALTIETHLALADDLDAVPIHKLTLVLDVPQVPRVVARANGELKKPFDVMCDVAIKLCASMEARILDEHGHVVDLNALQRTALELDAVYDRLDEVGLSAGSFLAKRLFS